MEQKVTEFQSAVDNIHTTGEFILKRLNQLRLSDGGHSDCICNHRTDTLSTEIIALQSQYKELEDKISKRNDNQLSDGAKSLNERLDLIENALFPGKTEHSKTRTDHMTNKNNNVLHKTKSVDWGGQTDPVLLDAAVKTKTNAEANKKECRDLPAEVGETFKSVDVSESKLLVTSIDRDEKMTLDPLIGVSEEQTNNSKDSQTGKEYVSNEYDVAKEKAIPMKNDSKRKRTELPEGKDMPLKTDAENKSDRENKLSGKSRGTITKPNFMKTKQQTVKTVKQEVKLVYDGEKHWRYVAQNELDRSRTKFQFLEGVHSIICLDISESMAQSNAWREACTFLTDYLTGLENMSKSNSIDLKTEYVAFVTFGHETIIQQGYTDSYEDVLKRLGDVKLGGPTQMYGGILMALAAAWSSIHRIERLGNGSNVFTKIIMVTDGRPTESELIAGPDIPDNSKVDETKAKILQEMERFRKDHEDLFFVPVGNADLEFISTMAACSCGMALDYKHGKRFARRQYLTAKLVDPLGLMAGIMTHGSESELSNEDKKDLRNIQEREKRHFADNVTGVGVREMYAESKSKHLPPIGSRVRRGPDWHYGTQDSHGLGTVIGHTDDELQVWVEWDTNGHQNIYMYGLGGYDVLIVDEPRTLKPGEMIAVGCEVKPGKDWRSSEGNMNRGVVIKLDKRNKKATVRWNNGKRGDYTYGDGALQEVDVKTEAENLKK
ncbi:uncharacterized protein LOC123554781 isoform X2 [Mercenaria mercenaria]|uniref:uncharacterized protein LOC123554781 isoform X2 n=1 Tax=Mercenaria mercenaria TaxID=6596 RepID=UPI00234EBBE3|nr:uncharacterized protein LOC123554781 isoform X2 [Mercenaria mercenaria]